MLENDDACHFEGGRLEFVERFGYILLGRLLVYIEKPYLNNINKRLWKAFVACIGWDSRQYARNKTAFLKRSKIFRLLPKSYRIRIYINFGKVKQEERVLDVICFPFSPRVKLSTARRLVLRLRRVSFIVVLQIKPGFLAL